MTGRANATYICGPTETEYLCPRCETPLLAELLGMLACPECDWDESNLAGGYCSPRGCDHSDCNEDEGCLHEGPTPHLDGDADAPE